MLNVSVWYGSVTSYNSTSIVIAAGSYVATYTGSFTFDVWGNVFGQLSSYSQTGGGALQFNVTNINRDAYTYVSYLNAGNAQGALEYVLSGADDITGSSWNDRLLGLGGADVLRGGGGADNLGGGLGNDSLQGGIGDDILYGAEGNDVLNGGAGRDSMYGGAGADRFIFATASETKTSEGRDKIHAFQSGIDRIDMSQIDARPGTVGNQAFSFLGGSHFSGVAGQLRYVNGVIYGDLNGDRLHDFAFELVGAPALTDANFIL